MNGDEVTLDVSDVEADPIVQVRRWLDEEIDAADDPVNVLAVALATATPDGQPSVRYVMLRGVDGDGLRFYTNRESRKGRDLAANPRASMALYWPRVGRQVRADGRVEPLSPEESGRYFATRPAASRHAAWASPQSTVVPDRASLEARFADVIARYGDTDVPLPPFWGGYRLVPHAVELWQSRPNRLHDRLRYRRDGVGTAWIIERLAP